jgi:hypothetical protein
MHSIINNADQVVNFLDWTTASLLGSSAVIVGQSLLARLRNEWHANHAPQQTPRAETTPSEPEPSEPEPESEPEEATSTAYEVDEVEVQDPWATENQTACKLPKKEATMARAHASNKRLLKEGSLSTQDYRRMKKQKLIEIARAKGLSGANKKKTKGELIAKLSDAS